MVRRLEKALMPPDAQPEAAQHSPKELAVQIEAELHDMFERQQETEYDLDHGYGHGVDHVPEVCRCARGLTTQCSQCLNALGGPCLFALDIGTSTL